MTDSRSVTSTSSKSASRKSTRSSSPGVAEQLERRVAFRRAMKRAVQSAMRLGAEGIKITCGGRLGGAKSRAPNGIAKAACRCTRCAPTSTTAKPTAHTAYGTCGIKVWIFKGEILEHDPMAQDRLMMEGANLRRRRPRALLI
jgi:small subunit ribosomal protein S3